MLSNAVEDGADAQSIGIRMRRDGFDTRDDDAFETAVDLLDAFDLDACHADGGEQLRAVARRIDPFAQPRFAELHVLCLIPGAEPTCSVCRSCPRLNETG